MEIKHPGYSSALLKHPIFIPIPHTHHSYFHTYHFIAGPELKFLIYLYI